MTVTDRRFGDARLRDLDPGSVPIPQPLANARESLARATSDLRSISDLDLEREWGWIGEGEGDVRSAFYLAVQSLEGARGSITRALVAAGAPVEETWGPLAAATEARWDLHGLLAALDEDILDVDPGGGEWTVRATLAHILASQRAYAWVSAWWLERRDTVDLPPQAPEELIAQLPTSEEQGSGGLKEIRARLDALVDLGNELWHGVAQETLAVRARWSGFPVTVGFRLGRWAPHLEEHTVQVEKTLGMLGRAPSEVDRLVRLVHRAFGRMEGPAFGASETALAGKAASAISSTSDEIERIAKEVAEVARRREA